MVKAEQLGQLEAVAVRDCWNDEARDFTPWLADHIALLGEAIGLELKVEELESKVGDFRADIVCKNMEDDNLVIVENQLEKTNHDHLGKLLTYAAGKNAKVIVWVARRFKDEHRAALDWLNENTSEDLYCFGIQIELWKIGNSVPAPKFHVVSTPNDWKKIVRRTGEMSDMEKLRFKFWTEFRDVVDENRGKAKPTGRAHQRDWMAFSVGQIGFHLTANIHIPNRQIEVRLIMGGQKAEAHHHLLFQQKSEVEKEVGQPLEWDARPNHRNKYIILWLKDCDLENEKQWSKHHLWLHEHLEKFYAVFHHRIQNLVIDDLSEDAQEDDD